MKKIIVSAVIIVGFALYLWFRQSDLSVTITSPTIIPTDTENPLGTPSSTGTSQPVVSSTPKPTSTPKPATGFKDGVYTSQTTDALYGPLQFKVTISGGRITDITFLQYPQGGHSTEVSDFALPALKQEAIAAQSANVQVVSGATQTSDAFKQGLSGVLSQVRA